MSEITENKMGVMPVKKLIVTMSLPMMISMLVQALYNIVDSYFVAKLSEDAMTAVTLVFPIQNLLVSFAMGIGVGINALLSKSLGEKDSENANRAANTGILLNGINYFLFLVIGLVFSRAFISSQTNNPVIIEYGVQYMRTITILSFGMFMQMTFERLLQSTGKTLMSMISQMTGAIINIILDPIMIFGLLGFPKLGVTGAALATVTGQVIAAIIAITLNIKTNHEIKISVREIFKPTATVVKKIYFVGVPSILMMAIGSIMTYLMNLILGTFSSTAQAVFGIYFKLQSFFFMPVFGLNNGLIPVMAYNYGARKKARIIEALRFSVCVAFVVMCIGTLAFNILPDKLLGIFNASDTMLKIGIPALRIIGLHFPLAAFGIVLGSVFQAFSKSHFALVVSLSRQLVALIPAAWFLSLTGVISNVWWCFLIAEVVSLIVTLIFFTRVKKTVIDTL